MVFYVGSAMRKQCIILCKLEALSVIHYLDGFIRKTLNSGTPYLTPLQKESCHKTRKQ
jgi:hypothetical protein